MTDTDIYGEIKVTGLLFLLEMSDVRCLKAEEEWKM